MTELIEMQGTTSDCPVSSGSGFFFAASGQESDLTPSHLGSHSPPQDSWRTEEEEEEEHLTFTQTYLIRVSSNALVG